MNLLTASGAELEACAELFGVRSERSKGADLMATTKFQVGDHVRVLGYNAETDRYTLLMANGLKVSQPSGVVTGAAQRPTEPAPTCAACGKPGAQECPTAPGGHGRFDGHLLCGSCWFLDARIIRADIARRAAAAKTEPPPADAPLRVGDRVHVIRTCANYAVGAPGVVVTVDEGCDGYRVVVPYLVETTIDGRSARVWCGGDDLRRIDPPAAEPQQSEPPPADAPLRVGDWAEVAPDHREWLRRNHSAQETQRLAALPMVITARLSDISGGRFRAEHTDGTEKVWYGTVLRRIEAPAAEPQQSEPHGWVEVGAWVRCRDCGVVGEVRTLYSTTASIWDHDTGGRHCFISDLEVLTRSQQSEPVAAPEPQLCAQCGADTADPYHGALGSNVCMERAYAAAGVGGAPLDERIAAAQPADDWAERMQRRYGRHAPQLIDPEEV